MMENDDQNVADQRQCQLPPVGWYCTRKPGHDGPCAAHPGTAPVAAEVASIDTAEFLTCLNSLGTAWNLTRPEWLIAEIDARTRQAVADARAEGWTAGRRDQYQVALEQRQRAEKAEAERTKANEDFARLHIAYEAAEINCANLEGKLEAALAQVAGGHVPVGLADAIKAVRAQERSLGSVVIGGKKSEVGLSFMVQQLGYAIDRLERATPQPAPVAGPVDDELERGISSVSSFINGMEKGWAFCERGDVGGFHSHKDSLVADLRTARKERATPPAISTSKGEPPAGYALQAPTGQLVGQVHTTRSEADRFAMPGNVVVGVDVRVDVLVAGG